MELHPTSEMPAALLQYEFALFAKDTDLADKLNELADSFATYGSIVLKNTGKANYELMDLRHFFCDPTVKSLQDSRFATNVKILSVHYLVLLLQIYMIVILNI